tara:strand:+ start:124 stop:315 length:192 start_codon:yes stop_codon:yes gene_type:complete
MKKGDIVRFHTHQNSSHFKPMWKHGLLIEYNTWEKIARILWNGKIISVRAENTQLAIRSPENI